jgi:hypothetical protein
VAACVCAACGNYQISGVLITGVRMNEQSVIWCGSVFTPGCMMVGVWLNIQLLSNDVSCN